MRRALTGASAAGTGRAKASVQPRKRNMYHAAYVNRRACNAAK